MDALPWSSLSRRKYIKLYSNLLGCWESRNFKFVAHFACVLLLYNAYWYILCVEGSSPQDNDTSWSDYWSWTLLHKYLRLKLQCLFLDVLHKLVSEQRHRLYGTCTSRMALVPKLAWISIWDVTWVLRSRWARIW